MDSPTLANYYKAERQRRFRRHEADDLLFDAREKLIEAAKKADAAPDRPLHTQIMTALAAVDDAKDLLVEVEGR